MGRRNWFESPARFGRYCTVNAAVFVFPIGVVTATFLVVWAAPFVITKFAVMVVELTTVKPVTVMPPPVPVSPVAPVRLAPVKVTATVVLCRPVTGAIEVSVAPCTVNVVVAVPPGVVMVTVLAERLAPVVIVKVAVAVVGPVTVKALTVTPVPETAREVAPVRFVPVSVTGTEVPRTPVLGAIEVSVGAGGAVTVNVTLPVFPAGVATLTFLAVSPAVAVIVNVAFTCVSLTTVRPLTVMPVPETFTPLAPVKPVPVRVTRTLPPRTPDAGLIEANVGAITVKVTVPVVPPGLVMLTFLAPVAAVAEMVNVAVTVVGFTTMMLLAVIPVPPVMLTAVAPVRFVPVRVTATAAPRTPLVGVIEVNVGKTTVKAPVRVLLVPPEVVTVTFLAPVAAVAEMVKVAVTVVAVDPVMTAVIPVPVRFTAETVARFVPVMVTMTEVFLRPEFGESDVSAGVGMIFWNSMAPISTGFANVLRGLP